MPRVGARTGGSGSGGPRIPGAAAAPASAARRWPGTSSGTRSALRAGTGRDRLLEVPVATAERAQPGPVVVGDGGLGDVGELEEQLVPGYLLLAYGDRGTWMRHRDRGQRADAVRAEHRRQPGDRRPPVMADHVRLVDVQLVQ